MLLAPFAFAILLLSVSCSSAQQLLMPYQFRNDASTYYLCTVANQEASNRCNLTEYFPVPVVGAPVHDALVLKGSRALYASLGALSKTSYENFLAKIDCPLLATVMDGCMSGATSHKLAHRIKTCITANDPRECREKLTDLNYDKDYK